MKNILKKLNLYYNFYFFEKKLVKIQTFEKNLDIYYI